MESYMQAQLRKERHWCGYKRAVYRVMLEETPLSDLKRWAENAKSLTEAELDYAAALGRELLGSNVL